MGRNEVSRGEMRRCEMGRVAVGIGEMLRGVLDRGKDGRGEICRVKVCSFPMLNLCIQRKLLDSKFNKQTHLMHELGINIFINSTFTLLARY